MRESDSNWYRSMACARATMSAWKAQFIRPMTSSFNGAAFLPLFGSHRLVTLARYSDRMSSASSYRSDSMAHFNRDTMR